MIVLVIALLVAARIVQVRRERRSVARHRRDLLPEVVDLFAIAAAAGHPPWRCITLVADRVPVDLRPAFERTCDYLAHGLPLEVALDRLGHDLGPEAGHLIDALTDAAASGSPLPAVLDRVVASARQLRRSEAELRARQLPVELLFPLVCCILPAFAFLVVGPMLVASWGSFIG